MMLLFKLNITIPITQLYRGIVTRSGYSIIVANMFYYCIVLKLFDIHQIIV